MSVTVNETPDKKKRQNTRQTPDRKHQTKTPDKHQIWFGFGLRLNMYTYIFIWCFRLVFFVAVVFVWCFINGRRMLSLQLSYLLSICNCRIYTPPPRPLTLVPWDWSLSCAATAMRSRLVLPIRDPRSVCVQPRALC